jgi:hypothetical protein
LRKAKGRKNLGCLSWLPLILGSPGKILSLLFWNFLKNIELIDKKIDFLQINFEVSKIRHTKLGREIFVFTDTTKTFNPWPF